MQQRSDEWLKTRVGKITASRANALMATTKAGKPTSERGKLIASLVAERLTGEVFQSADSFAMRRGRELEDEAVGSYAMARSLIVQEQPFVDHPTVPWCGCSPDGLVGDNGLIEAKCPLDPTKHLAALRDGAHAEEYRWQVQHQMMVTGRQWCDVVSYHPQFGDRSLAVTRVERDEDAINHLLIGVAGAHAEVGAILKELRAEVAA